MSTPGDVETRGPAIRGVAIAFPFITAVFIGARVYTRTRIVRMFGIDDWVAIASLVVAIAYSVCIGIWTHKGGGMHQYDITEEIQSEYFKWIMISSEFYALGLLGYKSAILLLYIRIFSINKKFKRACWAVMAFNAAYLLSNMILQIFSCTPVEKYYIKSLPGRCVSLIPPDITWGAMSMLSDFAIAILPIPIIWRLKLSKRDKILISLVFLSGLIAFLMALMRWITATIDLVAEDRAWIAGLAFLFSILEVNTGIICGCTATLKPLVRVAREHSSRRRSSSGRKYDRKHLFHRHHHHSTPSDEEKGANQPPRAPPGTLERTILGERLDTREESPNSHKSSDSAISRATTVRPSLAHNTRTEVSQDFLNLPKEGTHEQPHLHSQHDIYEIEGSDPIPPQQLPSPDLDMTRVITDAGASPTNTQRNSIYRPHH